MKAGMTSVYFSETGLGLGLGRSTDHHLFPDELDPGLCWRQMGDEVNVMRIEIVTRILKRNSENHKDNKQMRTCAVKRSTRKQGRIFKSHSVTF